VPQADETGALADLHADPAGADDVRPAGSAFVLAKAKEVARLAAWSSFQESNKSIVISRLIRKTAHILFWKYEMFISF